MRLLTLLLLALGSCSPAQTSYVDKQPLFVSNWKTSGRATFYGTDGWSIHRGSCGYGYIWPDEPQGWDVAAVSDVGPLYYRACGRCVEVRCRPNTFTDGYGQRLDRRSVCYDPTASVVVKLTDTCPCNYPTNAYSNRRWCCGDSGLTHFDLSIWAFEKLADTRWGVIGLDWREVPCSYRPARPAKPIARPTPGEAPPRGATHRPGSVSASSIIPAPNATAPYLFHGGVVAGEWEVRVGPGRGGVNSSAYALDGLVPGQPSLCADLAPGGGSITVVRAANASEAAALKPKSAQSLEFWVRGELPALALRIRGGVKGRQCRLSSLLLDSLQPTAAAGGPGSSRRPDWAHFLVDLRAFCSPKGGAGPYKVLPPAAANGPLTGVRLINAAGHSRQAVCIDGLRVVSSAVSPP